MSSLLLEGERVAEQNVTGWPSPEADAHGCPTLDRVITRAWEGLATRVSVPCPACGGTMAPRHAAGAVVGACRDCGAHLS
jgi:hypothetical protein